MAGEMERRKSLQGLQLNLPNQNIMCWICFLTQVVPVLHVGHPLGYIASDIYSRYKRLKGFNVLHPMGFDSFGLPAEQYALETGQHPADNNRKKYCHL